MKPRISVVIHTLNEEKRLPFALRSVRRWVDEIIVVDMLSDDATVEVAHRLGAQVYQHERTGFVEPARAFGCAQATGDWILVLDADELVPGPLGRRLQQMAAREEADGAWIPRLNYLLGEPLLHSGWNPERDRHLRFFKRGAVEFPTGIHKHIQPRPGVRSIRLPYAPGETLVHFNVLDTSHFLEKLDAYTTIEAVQTSEEGPTASPARVLIDAFREWAARYVRHGGFRDGWRGFYLCLFMALSRIAIHAKVAERQRGRTRQETENLYAAEAERLLAEIE